MDSHGAVLAVIAVSLIFTYTNGFQDGSSVVATAIASRALSPMVSIALVASAEFLGAIFGGSAVANTIESLTTFPDKPSILPVLASGLSAAIFWNFLTRALKIPSSSTHALIGGVVGAVVTQSHSWRYIVWGSAADILHPTGMCKVVISLFVSPLIGFGAGYILFLLMSALFLRASARAGKTVGYMQVVSLTALAFGHGANDTQKAMGLIVLALNAAGPEHVTTIPEWVRVISGSAMAFGVICFAPGIIKRVGQGIFKIHSLHAFVAQASSALVVGWGSASGGPISASQVIASSVIGVGAAQRRKGVRWLVARDMLLAWFFTIPGAALLAWFIHSLVFQWAEIALPK